MTTSSSEPFESSETPSGRGEIDDNSMPVDMREQVDWPGDDDKPTTPETAPGAAADVDSASHDPDEAGSDGH
jgi:hypothetical protein